MSAEEFERFLRERIPLAAAMEVGVVEIRDDSILLRAPLAPNINPHGTVFGGSASAVAILAAWSLVHLRLHRAGHAASEVIQSNSMEYLRPITGAFTARATLAQPGEWAAFERMLARRGRARVEASVALEQEGVVAARLSGHLVALTGNH